MYLRTLSPEIISQSEKCRITKTYSKIVLLILVALLSGCQTFENNETTYPYVFDEEKFKSANIKRIIIAHENLGTPSRKHLQPYSNKLDAEVKTQLVAGGFQVIDNQNFKSAWRGAVRKHGAPYNDQTGQMNQRALQGILYDVLASVLESGEADAVLFTDLIEREVLFQGRSQRQAKWDGVARPPKIRAGGSQLSADFNWRQKVSAASALLVLYDINGQFIFKGAGGLELTREIDPRSGNGRFVRRKELFKNGQRIKQGVTIALHPLVIMEGYVNYADQ